MSGEYPQSIINNIEISLNSLQPSASDQPTQRVSQHYEVPCEHPYEYVDKAAFTSPQTFSYDYASMDGLPRNGQQNEIERPNTEKEATYNGSYVIERSDTGEEGTHDGGYVIERSDTGEEGTHDRGYVIERSDSGEEDTHDGGYVIERSDTGEEDTHDGGYVIERSDTGEEGTHDGGYVIERSDTGEEDTYDGGYVIERSDTGEEGAHDEGYVIKKPDSDEGDTQDEGYVIEKPDTEKGGPHVPPEMPQYELSPNYQYEYPDQSQSNQYEYPSFKNTKPDIMGEKDVCVEELEYSPLVRSPSKNSKSENSGCTSLIKDQKGSKKVSNMATKDEADGLSCVEALDAHYTPLVRPPLKNNESENSYYTSLIKNAKQES